MSGASTSTVPRIAGRVVTLLYHDVTAPGAFATSGFDDALAQTYKLTVDDFRAHLDAVAAARADAPITVDAPSALPNGVPNGSLDSAASSWLITFDDGGTSALEPTADLLEARAWCGHFFITTGRLGTPAFLDRAGVRALADRGHVIGAHSVTHPARMAELDGPALRREWRESRHALEDVLGREVRVASVPGGLYAPHVARAAAAEGITVLFNSEPTTRPRVVDGCLVLGRYCFKTTSAPTEAARLAASHASTRAAQWALWNAKKVVKTLSPRAFGVVRSALTGRRA